jgi:hypothetical protein
MTMKREDCDDEEEEVDGDDRAGCDERERES